VKQAGSMRRRRPHRPAGTRAGILHKREIASAVIMQRHHPEALTPAPAVPTLPPMRILFDALLIGAAALAVYSVLIP
jgi:hypothetical protein